MRKLIVLALCLTCALNIVAQTSDELVISNPPVFHLDVILAEGIDIETIEYAPVYVDDWRNRVIYILDYNNMSWEYVPYPDNEDYIFVDEQGSELILYSESYIYDFDSEIWEAIGTSSNQMDSCPPEAHYYLSNSWNLYSWERESTSDSSHYNYTFCNVDTDKNFHITSLDIEDACKVNHVTHLDHNTFSNTQGDVLHLFYGTTETDVFRICQFNITDREFAILADLDRAFNSISLGYIDSNRLILEAYANISEDEYESETILANIYDINIITNEIQKIGANSESASTAIHRVFDPDDVGGTWRFSDYIFGGGFEYIWSESDINLDETFFVYSDEIPEIQPIFSRTRQNAQTHPYSISMSHSGKYLKIYEPIYKNGVIDRETIDIYTLDGKLLHSEVFDYVEPFKIFDYWLGDTTELIVAIRSNINQYTNIEAASISTIQILDEATIEVTHRDEDIDIVGGARSSPIWLDDTPFLAIRGNHQIQFLNLYTDEFISFFRAPNAVIECIDLTPNRTFDGVRIYVSDCHDTGQAIFEAQFTVTINPSGEDDGG